jgi:hypothetical protein
VTRSLYTTMTSAMRSRSVFPSDWRRVESDKLHRLIAELDRGRIQAEQSTIACR